jgi:metal-responsive CopG/Arc/MetJ family transcriptional regulator
MESNVAKIAVSLPADLLEQVEEYRIATGETRSHVIREAVAQYLRAAKREEEERAYAEAYRRMPETAEEIEEIMAFQAAALPLLALEFPWNEGDE